MGVEVAIALMIVGTAVTAYGQYQAGQDKKAALDYNAQIEERNAQVRLEKAEYDANQKDKRTRAVIASQRVAFAAGGFTVAGTPLDTLRDTATQGEMDRMAIMYGGEMDAENSRNQATLNRMEGKAASKAGKFAAAGTVLSGAGSATSANAQANASKPGSGLWS
jgi:hypothetical protein